MVKEGVILLGHGSRREQGNDDIKKMAAMVQQADPQGIYEAAFLSLSKPGLREAIDRLSERGVKRIIIMPIFLVAGNHISIDIPEEVEKQKNHYPHLEFVMARYLGSDPAIIKLIQERISEVATSKQEGELWK